MKTYLFLLAMTCIAVGTLSGCGGGGNNNNNAATACATQPGTTWNGSSCVYSGYGVNGVNGINGQSQCSGSCGVGSGLVQVSPQYGNNGCLPAYQGNPCVGNYNGQPVQSLYGNGTNIAGFPGGGGQWGGGGAWGGGGYYGGYQQYGYPGSPYPFPTQYAPYGYGRNAINFDLNLNSF